MVVKMRKIISLFVAMLCLVCIIGCNNASDSKPSKKDQLQAQLKTASIGDYIVFGKYEQDNNDSNGAEDIEWLVLKKTDERILVISRYILESTNATLFPWDENPERRWLNGSFYNDAFTDLEKSLISLTAIQSEKGVGTDTEDSIFLLSTIEVNNYFANDDARACSATEHALASGIKANEYNKCSTWLLRTFDSNGHAVVGHHGDVFSANTYSADAKSGLRPAMWIELE